MLRNRITNNPIPLDVGVIGGGPSGISACLELSKLPGLKIALFERDAELGGVPHSCNIFRYEGFKKNYDRARICQTVELPDT